MNYYVFEIKTLFLNNKIYFGLFDGLFNLTKIDKQLVLSELNCNPSTYRSQKLRGAKNKHLIESVLNYFHYSDFDFNRMNQYNILLSKVYYCCYYKLSKQYAYLLLELNTEICKNNILKPVLVLFRTLIYTSFEQDYIKSKDLVNDDINYLIAFKNTNYFQNEYKLIFNSILYLYDHLSDKEQLKIDKLSILYPKISWIWFFLKGGKAYLDKKTDEALANFDILINEFKSTNNLERYFMTLNNVACLYNVSGHYISSLKVTEKVIEYVFGSPEEVNRITNILMHYLFSKLMLSCYQEIIDFISIIIFDFKTLNVVSTITCIIAAYKLNNKSILEKLFALKINDPNFNNFVNYLKTGNICLLYNIDKSPYLLKLKKKLLEND